MFHHTLPVICCITSLTPRIKIYGRLFCSHLKRYRNSEKELLPWSPDSVSLSSGCLASLWEWLRKRLWTHPWVQLWTPDLTFLELGFSAHSLGMHLSGYEQLQNKDRRLLLSISFGHTGRLRHPHHLQFVENCAVGYSWLAWPWNTFSVIQSSWLQGSVS